MSRMLVRRPLKWKGQSGISLLELLIVMAIIAIIASILIPACLAELEKSRCAQAVADLKHVHDAWYVGPGFGSSEKRSCPIELELFEKRPPKEVSMLIPGVKLPPEDPWGEAYVFGLTKDKRHLVMCSGGKEGFGLKLEFGDALTNLGECSCGGLECGEVYKASNDSTPTKELVMISP